MESQGSKATGDRWLGASPEAAGAALTKAIRLPGMENQMEKKMENQMETGIIGQLIGVSGYMSCSLKFLKGGYIGGCLEDYYKGY